MAASMGYAYLLRRYVDDPRQATDAQIDQAAWDTVPQVAPLFWTFRIMVGLGVFFIVMMVTFFYLASRRRLDKYRWLLWVAVFSIPLPWVAIESGWFVAEFGRQPWIIEGVLPTAAAVSHLGIWDVLFTICGLRRDLHDAGDHRGQADAEGHPQGPAGRHAPDEGDTLSHVPLAHAGAGASNAAAAALPSTGSAA
jgi:cytochrome d ubiquinol oxidase subunit I